MTGDLRDRIEAAICDYVVGNGAVEACADAVLDALAPQQVGWRCSHGRLSIHACDDDDSPVYIFGATEEADHG